MITERTAAQLYELARRAGVVRSDAVPWRRLNRFTRTRWLSFAELLAPQLTDDHLLQAALDQPNPTAALRAAIDLCTLSNGMVTTT